MANDQTLPRGDQGADAAQQERRDWCDRLLKALGGSANPELIASVSDGAEKAAGLVGTDAAALTPADLDGIATVDMQPFIAAVTGPADILALNDDIARRIAEEERLLRELPELPMVDGLLAILSLARRLFDAGQTKPAFDLVETVKQARTRLQLTSGAGSEELEAPQEPAAPPLAGEWQLADKRRIALNVRRDELRRFITELTQKDPEHAKKPAQAAAKYDSDIGLAVVSVQTALDARAGHEDDTPANRQLIQDSHDAMDRLEERLGKAETAMKGYTSAALKHYQARAAVFIEAGSSGFKRSGGDRDGGGNVQATSRGYGIPQEALNRAAGLIDVMRAVHEAGELTTDTLEALRQVRADVQDAIGLIADNSETFSAFAELAATLRKKLADDLYGYRRSMREELLDSIRDAEKLLATQPARALAELADIETLRKAEKPAFTAAKEAWKELDKTRDKLLSLLTRDYASRLDAVLDKQSKVSGDERGEDTKFRRSVLDVLKRRRAYVGEHASEVNFAHDSAARGDEDSVTTALKRMQVAGDSIDDKLKELKELERELDQSGGAGKFARISDKLLRRKKGGPTMSPDDLASAVAEFEADMKRSDKELARRKALKETFKSRVRDLETMISDGKDTVDPEYLKAFKNHKLLLDATNDRRKAAVTSSDWEGLLRELDTNEKEITAFLATHARVDEAAIEQVDGRDPDVMAAVAALQFCGGEIDRFVTDLQGFVDARVKPASASYKAMADNAGGAQELAADATAVVDMIANQADALTRFFAAIAAAVGDHELDRLAADLKKAGSVAEEIAVRERAVQALQFRRSFLKSSPLVAHFDENPFDGGAATAGLLMVLARTEGKLMGLVKRR